jgi:hypothetical protein
MVVAGEELVTHGWTEAGTQYLIRGKSWLEGQLRVQPGDESHLYWLGSALYDLGEWARSRRIFDSLAVKDPDRLQYRGLAALAAARTGSVPDTLGAVSPRSVESTRCFALEWLRSKETTQGLWRCSGKPHAWDCEASPGSTLRHTATWWRSGTTVERYRSPSVLLRLLQRNRIEGTQATDGWDLTALARFFRIRRPRDNHPPGSVAAV